jgi:hypothetical protein
MDGWVDGWMDDGLMDGWMDGWMDACIGCICVYLQQITSPSPSSPPLKRTHDEHNYPQFVCQVNDLSYLHVFGRRRTAQHMKQIKNVTLVTTNCILKKQTI